MKDIKTKGSRGNRIVDESADLASKMKQGLVRSKDQFQNLADDGQVTADEYAQDKVKYWSEDAVHDVAHGSKETAKKTYDGGKKLVRQIKQKQRNADSIKQTAKSTGKQTFKTMDRNIKTAKQSAQKTVKTAEQTSRTTIKATKNAYNAHFDVEHQKEEMGRAYGAFKYLNSTTLVGAHQNNRVTYYKNGEELWYLK